MQGTFYPGIFSHDFTGNILMRNSTLLPLAAALALALAGCAEQATPGADKAASTGGDTQELLGSLSFTPCTLPSAFGGEGVEAKCGALEVPENRAEPNSRKIRLKQMAEDIGVPFHPGAAKFYKEAGVQLKM